MLSEHLQTLQNLMNLSFDGKGESFIEAAYLTPLLQCLGYEIHKDYEVIRHGDDGSSFKLKTPPVESGAVNVRNYQPDYIPTIRKKCFWIIESKSPKNISYPFDLKYIVQGLQYCLHPEIQSKYLLVTNGAYSAVYDAYGGIFLESDIYSPILEFKSSELIKRWPEIFELLSVERLRLRIENDLKIMFDKLCLSSLDVNYPSSLRNRICVSIGKHVSDIKKNIYKLQVDHENAEQKKWQENIELLSPEQILPMMEYPLGYGTGIAEYFVKKSIAVGITAQQIFLQLTENFELQCIFRKEHTFVGLCSLSFFTQSDTIKPDIMVFFTKHADADLPMHNQIECALLRYTRKYIVCSIYPKLREKIEAEVESAPELIKYVFQPTALKQTYHDEMLLHDYRFQLLKDVSTEQLAIMREMIEELESKLENDFKTVRSQLPDTEIQIGGFEGYGFGKKHYAFKNIIKNFRINYIEGDDFNTENITQ
jgi:hypothetical protein